eukprot:COSAG06_NODE_1167_length_10451_cov_16.691654_5_plen_71_part_00
MVRGQAFATEQGLKVFKRLLASADIFLTNYRPGVLEGWVRLETAPSRPTTAAHSIHESVELGYQDTLRYG